MSVWPTPLSASPALVSTEGELQSVRIAVDPRLLEDLLEALSELAFPINPQICHPVSDSLCAGSGIPLTMVEFPAYSGHVDQVCRVLDRGGFERDSWTVTSMLDELHSRS